MYFMYKYDQSLLIFMSITVVQSLLIWLFIYYQCTSMVISTHLADYLLSMYVHAFISVCGFLSTINVHQCFYQSMWRIIYYECTSMLLSVHVASYLLSIYIIAFIRACGFLSTISVHKWLHKSMWFVMYCQCT